MNALPPGSRAGGLAAGPQLGRLRSLPRPRTRPTTSRPRAGYFRRLRRSLVSTILRASGKRVPTVRFVGGFRPRAPASTIGKRSQGGANPYARKPAEPYDLNFRMGAPRAEDTMTREDEQTSGSASSAVVAELKNAGTAPATLPFVFALVGVLAVFPIFQNRLTWIGLTCVSIALTHASARARSLPGLHLGLLCSLLLFTLSMFGSATLWPVPPALATLAYFILAKRWPALGGVPAWFGRGKLDGAIGLLIGMSVLVSSSALVVWFATTEPDYSEVVAKFPKLPVYTLFFGVVVFSLINAALEEAIYRGVVMGALDSALGAGAAPVVMQAIVFGIVHVGGFPRGIAGVGLAAIYGLMMGIVRRQAGGMLAPWIAHVGTDVAIGSILLSTLPH